MQLGNTSILSFCLAGLILCNSIFSQTNPKSSFAKFNINNISTFIYNDGTADLHPNGDSGFKFPITSNKTCVYQSGFVWGTKIDGQIRVGGSTYNSGLTPGKILSNGIAENPISPNVRVYRVRPDYKTADLSKESADEGKTIQEIYTQYEKDWNEWPTKDGAPYDDVNKNGIYESSIDIPGQSGADQTLWFVANDLDPAKTKSLYGSLPIGVELQVTVWGYNQNNSLGNAIFKRYLFINKSNKQFEETHFGIWSDPDIGSNASKNLLGCDTTLNLGYDYSADNNDLSYGSNLPAMGFTLLQGPLVKGLGDDIAIFKNKRLSGYRNLPMTAFNIASNGIVNCGDPTSGDYIKGTLEIYNLLQGKYKNGIPFPDPIKGGTTKFLFSGEPIAGTGFLCGRFYSSGLYFPQNDYRMFICSGPFNLAAGDTQEVIFAELAAEGNGGSTNNLSAISLLKLNTFLLRNSFYRIPIQIVNQTKPEIAVTNFDGEILLDWGEDVNKINMIENGDFTYKLEGYNVYQFPKADSKLSDGKLVATFDKRNGITKISSTYFDPKSQSFIDNIILNGSDSGIKRHISIKNDALRNQPLTNWNEYYFGVTQYSYQSQYSFLTPYRESGVNIYKVMPQPLPKGDTLNIKRGAPIYYSHPSGKSGAFISLSVVDPTKLSNSEYEISFRKINNTLTLSVRNISSGKTIMSDQPFPNVWDDMPLVDGVLIKISNISSINPLTENDIYRYSTKALEGNKNLELENLDKINVFPNPIYGTVRSELLNNARFVTFTYLPQRANIRIFNLAGQLVRKLSKDSNESFFRWNMLNDNNFQIPTGLYIVHIELPDYGKVKILKLALLNDVFAPDRFIP